MSINPVYNFTMNLNCIIKELNKTIREKQPKKISSSWIVQHVPRAYRFIHKNIRTETDEIDWDRVTSLLEREFQRRWVRYRRKVVKPYENKDEVNLILTKHKDKLYTFITSLDEKDFASRDKILVKLVRLYQKGNVLAQQELVGLLTYTVDDWIDRYYYLKKWKGYTDDVEDKIKGCIRCYRYTGSFLGYLYKTLEYSGRGIVPVQKYSLDDPVLDGARTKIDYVVEENNT